jgi:hypothetical protein
MVELVRVGMVVYKMYIFTAIVYIIMKQQAPVMGANF